jgi:pyrroloquinoline-quinone synthase
MSPAEFEAALRAKGAYYHIHHPYHVAMYEGRATREQIQGWVANRFYYQVNIPLKDAAILANCPDREIRASGFSACSTTTARPARTAASKPGCASARPSASTRTNCAPRNWCCPACVCRGRLRQLRPPRQLAGSRQQLADRTVRAADPPVAPGQLAAALPVDRPAGYEYFRTRLGQAARCEHGLAITLQHYTTREGQERMLEILQFKLDILWSMLDAMSMAYELNRPPYHSVTEQRVWHKGITL